MMNNVIYLVTGAAGFLGSHVCDELLERGELVRALVLPGDKSVAYVPKSVEIVEGDLCDADSLEEFFTVPEGWETIVIHCASMVTTNPDYNPKLIEVNVGGTKNIIEKCLSHPECRKMVYVSSTGAIPEQPKGTPITETDRFAPTDEKTQVGAYSQSKAMATQEVLDACRERGLKACVVHPSGILGPKDYAVGETTGTVIKIMNGQMPIGMGGSFNLCDVRDLAYGCVAAADRGRIGECYILGNKEVTLKEVCQMLHDASGCRMPLLYVPIPMAYKLAEKMEKKAESTGEKPLMTKFAVYNLARNNTFDYSKAERELGYHTRPYAETLRDEARWLVEQGYIDGKHAESSETRVEKGMLTQSEADQLKTYIQDSDLIGRAAGVSSAAGLDALMEEHGITGYTGNMLDECYRAIVFSRDWDTVSTLLDETDYDSCRQLLAKYDMEVEPKDFDRIRDVVHISSDSMLIRKIFGKGSIVETVELLQAKGCKAVDAQFIATLRENIGSLVSEGMIPEQEANAFQGESFYERLQKALNPLMAMAAVTELVFHIEGAVDPAFMFAIAGGISLM